MQLNELSASTARKMIAERKVSIAEYVEDHIERVKARQSLVGAFEFFDEEFVRRQVRGLPDDVSAGALKGLPIAFKDIIDTRDMPTGYGSPIYANYRPGLDACVVASTRAAQGLLFGKAVSTEFASPVPSPKTRNPIDPSRTPGGSSSGSAAAVADFQVPLAIGTQTVASVIRPASYCGVYGYKPTWGDINYGGVKFSSPTLDTIGLFARTVDDLALFRSVLAEIPFFGVWTRLLPRPRIGVCRTDFWSSCDAEMQNKFEDIVQQLGEAGAQLQDMDMPRPFEQVPMLARWIGNREGALALAPERFDHHDLIGPELISDRVVDGVAVSYECYRRAMETLDRCRLVLDDIFDDIDVILTPAVTGAAPAGLESTGNPVFGGLWTGLHVPCVSIPGWKTTSGLPLAVQFVARRGNDLKLLHIAKWIEAVVVAAKPK